MSSPTDGKSEAGDSDLKWFEALSGRTSPDDPSPAASEGFAMRAALEQHVREIDSDPEVIAATSDAAAERMYQRVLEQAQKEQAGTASEPPAVGPSQESTPSNVIEFPWWRRRRTYAALAASVLLGIVVSQQMEMQADYPPPLTLRGDAPGHPRVTSPQPKLAAERLTEQLRKAGLRPGIFQAAKVYIVDVEVTADQLTAAQAAFAELQIKPAAGLNRVEISPP